MNLVKVKCTFCGKEFFRSKGRFNEAKKFGWKQCCSPRCLSKNRTKKQVLFCENCGKRFSRVPNDISPHNYCSQSCAAIANNKKCLKGHAKIKPKLKTCVKCGKQFRKSTGNRKYCSMKCRGGAEPKYTRQKLINAIKQKVQGLQRTPARREMKESKTCQKIFGSWNNAIIAAGFQPNRSHNQRMYRCVNAKATDGHICDSVSELIIDNWLTKNRIPHEKNIPYPETNHKADWAIFVEGEKIFIEYFGLANDSPRYDRAIREKKNICRKYGLKLIEIYPQDLYPKMKLDVKLGNRLSGCPNLHRN